MAEKVQRSMAGIQIAMKDLTLEEGFTALSHTICSLAIATGISKEALIHGVGGCYDVLIGTVVNSKGH